MTLLNDPSPLTIKKSPVEWEKSIGIRVMDPDGWREAEKDYAEPVTLPEFRELCASSTIRINTNTVWA